MLVLLLRLKLRYNGGIVYPPPPAHPVLAGAFLMAAVSRLKPLAATLRLTLFYYLC